MIDSPDEADTGSREHRAGARRDRVPQRQLPLCRRGEDAGARLQPRGRARRDDRARWAERAPARQRSINLIPRFMQPTAGRHPARRRADLGTARCEPARAGRAGVAGHRAVRRHDRRQHRVRRQRRRIARAGARRRRGRVPAAVHRVAAAGLRHARGRALGQALGRPAPAAVDRARAAEERADPAARRGDLGARFGVRALHPGLARQAHAGAYDLRGRAPPVDHRARRPHRRAWSRAASSRSDQHRQLLGQGRLVRPPVSASSSPRKPHERQPKSPHPARSRFPVPAHRRACRRTSGSASPRCRRSRASCRTSSWRSRTGPTSSARSSPITMR